MPLQILSASSVIRPRPFLWKTDKNMDSIVKWVQWSTAEGGNGHWYGLAQLPGSTVSWTDAVQAATRIGANAELASLNTEAEHDFVKSHLMETSFTSRAWLGGFLDEFGWWSWLNGESIGFTNWAPGEPNNAGGTEDKLMIYRDGNWNDANTNDGWGSNGYLIETDIAPVIPTPPPAVTPTDVIVVRSAEDAYQGDARFQLFVDYQPVGPVTTVTTPYGEGAWQDFTFMTVLPADAKVVSVVFLNDLYHGTMETDRNLYLRSVTINGKAIMANDQEVKDTTSLQIADSSHGQKPFWLPWSDTATNTVKGTWFGDWLYGTDGNDRFEAGHGRDYMAGGAGDDTYLVDSSGDFVLEAANAGIDSIRSWLDLTKLPGNVENLYLNGMAGLAGVGNDLDNRLMGNGGSNALDGGKGNDILYGNGGADTLVGGAGNDIFGFLRLSDGDDVVKDFTAGVDMIDLRNVHKALTQADPDAHAVAGLVQRGTGTAVVVHLTSEDVEGATMVTLDHIAASELVFGKDILW
jgi:hypothetical protein